MAGRVQKRNQPGVGMKEGGRVPQTSICGILGRVEGARSWGPRLLKARCWTLDFLSLASNWGLHQQRQDFLEISIALDGTFWSQSPEAGFVVLGSLFQSHREAGGVVCISGVPA